MLRRLFSVAPKTPLVRAIRRFPVIDKLIRAVSFWLFPAGTYMWITVRQGMGAGLQLYAQPRFGEISFGDGLHEPLLQHLLEQYLHPGMTMYDVGANIGFFGLISARIVGEQGHVFAFEANPEVSQHLQMNCDHNQLTNMTIVPQAVWRTSGEVRLYKAGGQSAISRQENDTHLVTIPATSLDDFIALHPAPDIIKMDIEGAELDAIHGATSLFTTKPPILICEVHSATIAQGLQDFFHNLDYRIGWYSAVSTHGVSLMYLFALPNTQRGTAQDGTQT
jgi:FkbM family methyltransferase